jgi:hypothetical protein
LKIRLRPSATTVPVFRVVPPAPVTETVCGTLNMSTCELLSHSPPGLYVNSLQSNRMSRLGSFGDHGAGWTRPSGVRKNLSFAPKDMYIRPDRLSGTWTVRVAPSAGPAIVTSGAGLGGMVPPDQGVNAPPAVTYPSRPVVRLTPRTYR